MPRKTIGNKIPPLLTKPVVYPPVQLALPNLFTRIKFDPDNKRRGSGRQGPPPSAPPQGAPRVCTHRPPAT